MKSLRFPRIVTALFVFSLILLFQNCDVGFQANSLNSAPEGETSLSSSSTNGSQPVPVSTPVATPSPAPTPASPSNNSGDSTAVATEWVYKLDNSRLQYIGDGVALSSDQAMLRARGIVVYGSNKAFKKNSIPYTFSSDDALRRLTGSTGSHYSTPRTTLYSGVHNAFQIASSDVAKAMSVGFTRDQITNFNFAVDCGGKETAFIFGQSNAANSGEASDRTPIPGIFMFYNGFCYPAMDPILGASVYSGGGSLWMPMARAFHAQYPGKELVLFSFGVGGSAVRDWASGGALSARLTQAIAQVKASRLNVTRIFWHQGESDTVDLTTEADYSNTLKSIFLTLRSNGLSAPIGMAVVSYMSSRPYSVSREIQNAQFGVMESDASISLALASDFHVDGERAAADGLHFSSAGLQSAGQDWFRNVFLYSDGVSRIKAIIRGYYRTFMVRDAADGEVTYWYNRLVNEKKTLTQVRQLILQAPEPFVHNLYRRYARRIPERDGYDYWMNQVQQKGAAQAEADFRRDAQNVTSANTLFELIDGTLQPRLSLWRLDRGVGLWVRK